MHTSRDSKSRTSSPELLVEPSSRTGVAKSSQEKDMMDGRNVGVLYVDGFRAGLREGVGWKREGRG